MKNSRFRFLKHTTSPFHVFLLVVLFLLASCEAEKNRNWVGDATFEAAVDDINFKPCDLSRAMQYHNFEQSVRYIGEKTKLEEEVLSKYDSGHAARQSGMIRIRFLVNCNGETGMFRIMGMDEDWNEFEFDKSITDQLLSISKGLNGWPIKQTSYGVSRDYYMYLLFKIKNGQITQILP